MNNIFKNNKQNNWNIISPIITEARLSQNNSLNLTPFLKYINNSSPSPSLSVKKSKSQYSNLYYTPFPISTIHPINHPFYDIKKLTINHNTNVTNLNLFLFCNKDNPINENKKEIKKIKPINLKEPRDSIRRKILQLRNHPNKKDNTNIISEQNDSIKYSINKKSISRSSSNNIKEFLKRNKIYKKEVKNIKNINNRTIISKFECKPRLAKNEPKGNLDLSEFILLDQIGKGTFGKIFAVKWKNNNNNYALKKEIFNNLEYVEKRKNINKIIKNYLEKTKDKGIIQIYSNLCEKNKEKYNYYELMEIGDQDWEKEINTRRQSNSYYTEKELNNILYQLIKTLSLLQKSHITHRDIKPQNIIIINGLYKLCDFGEIRLMKREGIVVQRIRGSELYMSPILFYGLRRNIKQVKHNTYKSDVFSLGMCLLYAATMYFDCTDEIRELTDMRKINQILYKYLSNYYSNKFISLLSLMLQIEERLRPDFIQLEEKFINSLNDN